MRERLDVSCGLQPALLVRKGTYVERSPTESNQTWKAQIVNAWSLVADSSPTALILQGSRIRSTHTCKILQAYIYIYRSTRIPLKMHQVFSAATQAFKDMQQLGSHALLAPIQLSAPYRQMHPGMVTSVDRGRIAQSASINDLLQRRCSIITSFGT